MPAAFVFLSCLLVWLIIGARGLWWLKVVTLAVTAIIGWEMWNSLESYLGYPKLSNLDKLSGLTANLIWVEVDEPDNVTGDPGAVYLWMLPNYASPRMLQRGASLDPQSIKLPYTKETHKAAQSLMDQILAQQGQPLAIQFSSKGGQGSGKGGKPSHGKDDTGDVTGSMSLGDGVPYALPKPKSPPKVAH